MITDTHRYQVLSAQQTQKPLLIKTHTFRPTDQAYVDRLLDVFLGSLGLPHLLEPLSFCVRELAVNAKKANTKRIYFQVRNLDPLSPRDYRHGMTSFKRDILDEQSLYLQFLRDKGLYVKIELLKWQNSYSLAVRNNALVLPDELDRVRDRIAQAQRSGDLESVLGTTVDESEGAGLGIVVLIMMLKQLGFSGDFFHFYTVDDETVARIILPLAPA